MERSFRHDIMPEIKTRWSARAISSQPVARDDLLALVEAASFAPSSYNEQPWRYIIADDALNLPKMRSVLTDFNQEWANRAPALLLIAAKKLFSHNHKVNYWHMFDAGTSWGYLSLEAQRRGLIAHAMGGYNREDARRIFSVPDTYDIIAIIAVGYPGELGGLSEKLQKQEHPKTRKRIEDLLL